MKTSSLAGFIVFLLGIELVAYGQAGPPGGGGSADQGASQDSPVIVGAPQPVDTTTLSLPPLFETNDVSPSFPPPLPILKQVRPVPSGGIADWGMVQVTYPADICDAPVTVLAPDGVTLAFRPTFLTLFDRHSNQYYLLATITNTVGVISDSEVIFSNAFDNILADVRYVYQGTSIEQFIVIRQSLSDCLPTNLLEADLSLGCWTEWFDSEPLAVQLQTAVLRPAEGAAAAVEGPDMRSDFGYLKLTAGGRAFSVGDVSDGATVAKRWAEVEPDVAGPATGQAATDVVPKNRRFLLEDLDYQTIAPALSGLGAGKSHASLGPPKSSQSLLAMSPGPRASGPRKGNPLLVGKNSTPQRHGFEIDFNLGGCYPRPSGAISWWMGETNAVDTVGTNNGTAYNGVTYTNGKVVQAFNFNGASSQHIRVPNSATLNPLNLTVEAWVYPTTLGTAQTIVGKWDAVSQNPPQMSYVAGLYADGRAYFAISYDGSISRSNSAVSTVALKSNQWTHVVGTFDGTSIRIFVNGTNQASTLYHYWIANRSDDVGIGGCVGGLPAGQVCNPFYGRIDEVTLYNRALTTSEIQSIYSAGAAGKCSSCACIPIPNNYADWWSGDGTPSDLTSTNSVILDGGASFGQAFVNQGFIFNGTNALGRVLPAPGLDLGTGTALTIEGWLDPQSTNPSPLVLWTSYLYSGVQVWGNYPMPGALFARLRGLNGGTNVDSWIWTTNVLNLNAFNHVGLTYNRTSGIATLYANGAGTAFNSGPMTFSMDNGVYLGFGVTTYLNGQIDELTSYRRDLSAAELASIYVAGPCGKCKADSDGDGLPDLWETTYFGNLNQSPDGDYDGDGLTNLQEYQLGTKPSISDSDGDGVPDGIELLQGCSPLIPGTLIDTNNVINLRVFTPSK